MRNKKKVISEKKIKRELSFFAIELFIDTSEFSLYTMEARFRHWIKN